MSILDHPLLARRMFFPRADPLDDPCLVEVDGACLACAHVVHDPAWPTVLHFHGNGEVVADYLPEWARVFGELGYNAFFAEFRGYGGSTGLPSLTVMLDDALRVFDALGQPAEHVVAFGRSIGSICAIHLAAAFPALAGLVLESAIADPLERVLVRATADELGVSDEALREEVEAHLDPRRKLATYNGPLLVLHACHDHLVDRSHADRLAGWAAGTVRKVLLPKGDHNTVFWANREHYLLELRQFLASAAGDASE